MELKPIDLDADENGESSGQLSQGINTEMETTEVASVNAINNNENGLNMQMDHGLMEGNGDEIRIKEESNIEVKQEPIEEELPRLRSFMASEIDSKERSNANFINKESLSKSRPGKIR